MSAQPFSGDPAVLHIEREIRKLETARQTEQDAVLSWDYLFREQDGPTDTREQDEARAKVKKYDDQIRKLKNAKRAIVQRREAAFSQPSPGPMPGPSAPSTSSWRTPAERRHRPSIASSSTFSPKDSAAGRNSLPYGNNNPDTPSRGNLGQSRPDLGFRSGPTVSPIRTDVPSGASTPNGKRSYSNTSNLTQASPGRSKRSRVHDVPSSPNGLNSGFRPASRESTGSSIIDLTGDDDEVRASIDFHRRKAEDARRISRELPFNQARPSHRSSQVSAALNGRHTPVSVNQQPGNTSFSAANQMPGQLPNAQPFQMPGSFPSSADPIILSSGDEATPPPSAQRLQPQHQHQQPLQMQQRPPLHDRRFQRELDRFQRMFGVSPNHRSQQRAEQRAEENRRQQSRRQLSNLIERTNGLGSGLNSMPVIDSNGRFARAGSPSRNETFFSELDGDGISYLGTLPPRAARIFVDQEKEMREGINQLINSIMPEVEVTDSDSPEVLRYPLYKHQMIALKWMQEQEQGPKKGGILADDMGLGKTISMLSLIVSRPAVPSADDMDLSLADRGTEASNGNAEKLPFTKTNLIVLPKALMRQWEEEIRTKLKCKLSIYVFHGAQKAPARKLMTYDIVLTTYQTLLADWTRMKKFWKDREGRNVNMDTDRVLAQDVCFFHPKHALFYRIILDESQHIKNDLSKTSLAACDLRGVYRWCMSGTPMMNSVDELFPLYRFLQVKPYNDKKYFRKSFGALSGKRGDPEHVAMRNLQVILKSTMLRRSKQSEIDGEPIIVLPAKFEEIVHVTMDADQLAFYEHLANNARITVNNYLREGTLGKHYSHVLELLLRMRQACCHPHLIDGEEEQPEVDDDMLHHVETMRPDVIQRIKDKAMEIITKAEGGFECPICYDTIADPSFPLPCGHEMCHTCLREIRQNAGADNIRNGSEDDGVRCPVCRDHLGQHVVTYTAFKKIHMPELASSEEEEADADDSDSDESESDDDLAANDVDSRGNLKDFIVADDEDDDGLEDVVGLLQRAKVPSKSKKKGKAKDRGGKPKRKKVKASMLKHLRKEGSKNLTAKRQYLRYLNKNWMTSAKVDACLDLLRKIRDDTDGEKTIIFSQWTMFLDFIEVALSKDEELKRVGHVRFDGSMSMNERDAAVKRLRDDDNTKIMLLSLKAGNAGLNLVSASRVIILDPFWNPYTEMQAVDRAHRIGQQREVKVYRILIKDTVEDRIMDIKEKKEKMISSALDEGVAKKLGTLGVSEIRSLFGI